MIAIIPSILVQTPEALNARLKLVQSHGVKLVQLDVCDHTFVPATTFHDPEFIDRLNPTAAFEIHLMTTITAGQLQRWNQTWVKKIIFHLEATAQPAKILSAIRQLGKLAGLALNPETSVSSAAPFLKEIDTLLIMGVNPGWGGQNLLPDTTPRLRQARHIFPDGNLEVDGSVNAQTIPSLAGAGANLLVVGSALTENNFSQQFQHLTSLANAAFQTPKKP